MSTQQQIDAWRTAVAQKEQERADQATILKVQQEEFAKAEEARSNAELALQRARSAGASPEQVAALQRQVQLADQAESQANIAAGQTADNIAKLDGSIRYNQSQLALYQGSVPAQANPSSTVADQPANAATNAAQTAPAPVPAANTPTPVPPSQAGDNGGFVTNAQGEQIPSDSAEAEEIRAAQNRVEAENAAPLREFVIDPVTGEQVPSDSDRAAEIRAEAAAEEVAVSAPEPVNDFVIDPVTGEQVPSDSDRAAEIRAEAAAQEQVQVNAPAPVADSTQAEGNAGEAEASAPPAGAPGTLDPQQQAANEQAAAKANTINQATLNSVYKKEGSADWRVRLQLAPSSNYLYNQPEGQRGILDSLYYTNGVIFPYTPQINTSYKANYEQYDLVHSNYRGVYYKNSRVDDLQIRGVFTAQDTNEANYLLAVIHFFRSVTKMFYGKDDERGTPPPLVYLSGFGMDQFYGHPCVVTSFAYNLPDNVDYIRATSVNNYGTDLLSRRTASSPSSAAGLGATGNRLLNAGLANFTATPPAPSSVVASINNTQLANYVPTKMDIDITLIPVQTRSQVSKQFSLKGFANGELIKGGFW